MAQIVINEISQNYTYNIGRNSFATVAFPITSSWGPAYVDPGEYELDDVLEQTKWVHFTATQQGLESFVAMYRGPSSNYRIVKDYSYQMAMTLLTAGYDILVCRVCPGNKAEASFRVGNKVFGLKAKYPGTFGNNLKVILTPVQNHKYWSITVYIMDSSGIQTAVENLVFVFEEENATDSIPHINEVESKFLTFASEPGICDPVFTVKSSVYTWTPPTITIDNNKYGNLDDNISKWVILTGGSDTSSLGETVYSTIIECVDKKHYVPLTEQPLDWEDNWNSYYTVERTALDEYTAIGITISGGIYHTPPWVKGLYYKKLDDNAFASAVQLKDVILEMAQTRYTSKGVTDGGISLGAGYDKESCDYLNELKLINEYDSSFILSQYHKEWCYTAAFYVYQLLKDKLNYNPQRIISPGWDDQDICSLNDSEPMKITRVSPLHKMIMETAYYSRCATGMIDIPRSCARKYVYNDTVSDPGYAQQLSRMDISSGGADINSVLYCTHSALFAPWGQFKYTDTGKQNTAPPSFLALLIQRAQILNQSLQYEWALPTNRKHNLKIGKLDYNVPKKILDIWQKLDGVSINVLTEIPELGVNLWGNSTLFEVPPATYQALANLSTRYLVNAVENTAYKCGISITFQYNNEQAYNKFYAGITPLLDTMKNVGAIDDYYVKMDADINGLDQVNANTVIGKIYLVINGVINDIIIDLIALPPGADLDQ